jgi:arylsulfatase A-like enzyme
MTQVSVVTSGRLTATNSPATGFFRSLLAFAIWAGLVVGLLEGLGLLVFQKINWENWGRLVHVSREIVWISALVDVIFFCFLAILIGLLARVITSRNAVRVAAFCFSSFAVFDWLRVTSRISSLACLLLGVGTGVVLSRWAVERVDTLFSFSKKFVLPLAILAIMSFTALAGQKWFEERSAVASLPKAAPETPNVIMVVVDTLRADHLSCYGYSQLATPNIDRLAREGVLFSNAFSASSWTLPSHVSLLTGRFQFDHGIDRVQPMSVRHWGTPPLGNYLTLGQIMERKGYRTGAFSGNRTFFSADLGFKQGFIHFEDYFHSPADMFVRTTLGKELVRDLQFSRWTGTGKRVLHRLGLGALLDRDDEGAFDVGGPSSVRKRAAIVNAELLRWADRDRQRPFFAFLNYFDVHSPYGLPQSSTQDSPAHYDDGVSYVDEQIGQLMSELKRRGLDGNTLVIVTSDHGEGLGQRGLLNHGKALYDFLIHIPLVFWYPGRIPAGLRIPATVTNASVPATIATVIGSEEQTSFPAGSLASLWTHPSDGTEPPPALSELAENKFSEKLDHEVSRFVMTARDGPMKSLVDGDWHLIVHKNLGDQLYNRRDDPGELKNLVGTASGIQVHSKMLLELEAALSGEKLDTSGSPNTPRTIRLGEIVEVRADEPTRGASPRRVNDHFRIEAKGGDVISVEVRSKRPSRQILDPVVMVLGESGELLQSCRNPGDDHIPSPGLADATPNAFDDICLNDDIEPLKNTDSRLEILVPGSKGLPVSLQFRVYDWNGAEGLWNYTISSAPATTLADRTHQTP